MLRRTERLRLDVRRRRFGLERRLRRYQYRGRRRLLGRLSPEFGYRCSGAPSICTSTCGDGFPASNEGCDDGNTNDSDGCSASCTVEDGYICLGIPSVCQLD